MLQEERNSDKMGNGKRIKSTKNNKRKTERLSCISRDLYDKPLQSDFFLFRIYLSLLHNTFIGLSRIRFGQLMISYFDYQMVKVKNTLDFCIPDTNDFASQKIIDRHRKTLPIKDRPMSWLFFIPVLIFVRILRFFLNVYAIIVGQHEITVLHMRSKVIAFRRYYRSIRHYAVTEHWTGEELTKIENRKKANWAWKIYYIFYEMIFMTRPLVEQHSQPNGNAKVSNGAGQKEALNVSEAELSDDELNVVDLLDKYADEPDSQTVDPDYEPPVENGEEEEDDEESSGSNTSNYTEDEKDESKGKLNPDNEAPNSEEVPHSSNDDKSNENLTKSQMNDLENEIMKKILKLFEENRTKAESYSSDEIFYSPIGSPPDANGAACAINADSEVQTNQEIVNKNHE